jgi:hypothetical protein
MYFKTTMITVLSIHAENVVAQISQLLNQEIHLHRDIAHVVSVILSQYASSDSVRNTPSFGKVQGNLVLSFLFSDS